MPGAGDPGGKSYHQRRDWDSVEKTRQMMSANRWDIDNTVHKGSHGTMINDTQLDIFANTSNRIKPESLQL